MPRKTKKEKIIAELRRKLEHVEVKNEKLDDEVRNLDILKTGNISTTLVNQNIPPQHLTSHLTLPTSYIIKDLRKTFILAGLAISLELIVYWLSELGGSKFFR